MVEKTTIMAVSIFLIIIAITSFLIFRTASEEDPNNYVYNDFRIIKNTDIVGYTVVAYLDKQQYNLKLRNDPPNTENITVEGNPRTIILSKPTVYLTMEPNLTSKSVIAALEVANIISRKLGIYNKETIGAITRPVPDNPITIATCDNVTLQENVILFRIGDETKVFLEKSCIIVQGTNEWEIIRASDRLVYDILEVFKSA